MNALVILLHQVCSDRKRRRRKKGGCESARANKTYQVLYAADKGGVILRRWPQEALND